jgi:hypothetical protein
MCLQQQILGAALTFWDMWYSSMHNSEDEVFLDACGRDIVGPVYKHAFT